MSCRQTWNRLHREFLIGKSWNTKPLKFISVCVGEGGPGRGGLTLARHGYPHLVKYKATYCLLTSWGSTTTAARSPTTYTYAYTNCLNYFLNIDHCWGLQLQGSGWRAGECRIDSQSSSERNAINQRCRSHWFNCHSQLPKQWIWGCWSFSGDF